MKEPCTVSDCVGGGLGTVGEMCYLCNKINAIMIILVQL
jgi:hypothetical protein